MVVKFRYYFNEVSLKVTVISSGDFDLLQSGFAYLYSLKTSEKLKVFRKVFEIYLGSKVFI